MSGGSAALFFLAGLYDGGTEGEALKAIDGRKGNLDLVTLFEYDSDDDDARDLIAFLAARMKTKKAKKAFLESVLLAAVARPSFVNLRKAVIDLAISWGEDIEKARFSQGSMLAMAASFGRPDMVKSLLDLGVSPEGLEAGEPLRMLLGEENGHERYVECARLLIDAGAVVEKKQLRGTKGPLGELLKAAWEKRRMASDTDIKPGKDKGGKGGGKRSGAL